VLPPNAFPRPNADGCPKADAAPRAEGAPNVAADPAPKPPNAGAAGAANAGAADALANAGAPTPPKIGGLLDVPNAGAGALGKTLAAGGEAPNAVGDCDGDVPNTVLEVAGMPNGLVLNAFADEGAANGLAAVLTGEDAAGGIALPNALEGLD